jgi:hypothetical protein
VDQCLDRLQVVDHDARGSADHSERQRGRTDGAIPVALVVQGELHADATLVGTAKRRAIDPERTDLAAGEEHEVVGLGLELISADELGSEVDRRGLVDDELRTYMERRVE